MRSRLFEATTPEDLPNNLQELKLQQLIPECTGKESPGNGIARTQDNESCRLVPQALTITRNYSNGKPPPAGQKLDNSRELEDHDTGLKELPSQPEKLCHPDTWSLSQGEPGDSDPFYPQHASQGIVMRLLLGLGLLERKTSKGLMRGGEDQVFWEAGIAKKIVTLTALRIETFDFLL